MKTSRNTRFEEYQLLSWRSDNGRIFLPSDVRRYGKLRREFAKCPQVDLKRLKVVDNQ